MSLSILSLEKVQYCHRFHQAPYHQSHRQSISSPSSSSYHNIQRSKVASSGYHGFSATLLPQGYRGLPWWTSLVSFSSFTHSFSNTSAQFDLTYELVSPTIEGLLADLLMDIPRKAAIRERAPLWTISKHLRYINNVMLIVFLWEMYVNFIFSDIIIFLSNCRY